jgi:hypothetical protein
MAKPTILEANAVERTTPLRVKFAFLDARGGAFPDATADYDDFYADLPAGWRAEKIGDIETRTENQKEAWYLTDGQTEVVAVQHETGIEILLVLVVAPVAANLVADGIKTLVKWGWHKWNKRRQEANKPDASVLIEVPRSTRPDRPPIRLVIPPPVDPDEVVWYLQAVDGLKQRP